MTRPTERLVAFETEGARERSKLHIPPPSRVFRSVYVAQVGRFAFRLLHRLEGGSPLAGSVGGGRALYRRMNIRGVVFTLLLSIRASHFPPSHPNDRYTQVAGAARRRCTYPAT